MVFNFYVMEREVETFIRINDDFWNWNFYQVVYRVKG